MQRGLWTGGLGTAAEGCFNTERRQPGGMCSPGL